MASDAKSWEESRDKMVTQDHVTTAKTCLMQEAVLTLSNKKGSAPTRVSNDPVTSRHQLKSSTGDWRKVEPLNYHPIESDSCLGLVQAITSGDKQAIDKRSLAITQLPINASIEMPRYFNKDEGKQ